MPYCPHVEEEIKKASFAERLITKIIDNLQFSVKNIHVRFEDSITNPKVWLTFVPTMQVHIMILTGF